MLVLVNSDILFRTYLIRELPAEIRDLADSCGKHHIPIVIPQTALLEFQHKQDLRATDEHNAIRNAITILDSYAIGHDDIDLEDLVVRPDLVHLLQETGADIEVEEPTLADYQEAHRRACFHLPPTPPDTKSDEMRDLVIWVQSVRLAKERGQLLLLSRDKVHVGPLGNAEASEVGITRVKTMEDALGYLELQSPAGRLAQGLLEEAAPALREEGLPLTDPVEVRFVRRPKFVQADFGLSEADFEVEASTTDERSFVARIHLSRDRELTHVSVSEALLGDEKIEDLEISFTTPVAVLADPSIYGQRIEALRQVLGVSNEPSDG